MKKLILSAACLSLLAACGKESSKKPPIINQNQLKESPKGTITSGSGWDWFTRDPELDGVEGTSSDRAIEELKLQSGKQIVVAVIDSGIDVHHEDLRNVMWRNPGEILDGKDNDNNGYIDDIYGWNFLGGKKGDHVNDETLEVTREVKRYEDLLKAGADISEEKKAYYEAAKAYVAKNLKESGDVLKELAPLKPKVDKAIEDLRRSINKAWNVSDFTPENIKATNPADEAGKAAKKLLLQVTEEYRSIGRFNRLFSYYKNAVDHYYNVDMVNKSRLKIVGDNPDDFTDKNYGNNDVTGPDPSHGTHVAGMIAAERGNGLGIDGIANNVRIMALRSVPNGDERDKDIALAVEYAVNNGAHIINMSFGKSHSPNKPEVDAAFKKAAEAGVLIVHAAGNDNKDLDVDTTYPNPKVMAEDGTVTDERISNWMTIGASAQLKDKNMVASFSNYGKKNVDVFAPGVLTRSTTPGDQYDAYSGTSMACPATAGVAALVWSNMGDEFTAAKLREALLANSRKYPELKVLRPGAENEEDLVLFSELSATGGVIDALATLKALKGSN